MSETSNIDSSMVRTAECPVCRTVHSGPPCPAPRSHTEATSKCEHSPFAPRNTLIFESAWFGGQRIRCKVCGGCAEVTKRGRIKGETCACHGAIEARPDDGVSI